MYTYLIENKKGQDKVSLLCHMGSEIYGTLSVRQHDMSLPWDFQLEVGQQHSSYAFFWLGPSWLVLSLGSLGPLGLVGSFY